MPELERANGLNTQTSKMPSHFEPQKPLAAVSNWAPLRGLNRGGRYKDSLTKGLSKGTILLDAAAELTQYRN